MKLTLISTTSNERITIDSFPFTLGRLSLDPLVNNPQSKANLKHVSKSHAKLNLENSVLFLQDAGSLNGTYLNNSKISQDNIGIKPGDLLSLAQKLDFIVDIQPAEQKSAASPFFLKDEKSGSSTKITTFPFYCTVDLLQNGSDSAGQQESAQCVISFIDNAPFIAPLTHDCPVRVDGSRLAHGHTLLSMGSSIASQSGQSFTFSDKQVVQQQAAPSTPPPASRQADIDADQTVYMEDATMFMSVFNSDDQKKMAHEEQKANLEVEQPQSASQKTASLLKSKFFVKLAAVAAFCLVVTGGVVFYNHSTPSYKANQAYEQKEFSESLAITNDYLAKNSDKKLEELATQSLIKVIAPHFYKSFAANDFQGIQEYLDSLKGRTSNIPAGENIIKTFRFVTRVNQFAAQNGGSQGIDDDSWKNDILSINKEWNSSNNQYKATISEIRQTEPSLSSIFEGFFSKINDCREYEIYYINKIASLEQKISSLLVKGDYSGARKLVSDFSKSNPKLGNIDKWLNDLNGFEETTIKLQNGDLFKLVAIGQDYTPFTVLFRKLKADHIGKHIPSEEINQHLVISSQHWSSGDIDKAVGTLKNIPLSPHQEKIDNKLSFLYSIQNQLTRLDQDETVPDCLLLAELSSMLEGQDTILFEKFSDQLNICSEKAMSIIPPLREKALTAYKQFRQNGGISGQMRMEAAITPAFKKNAALLTTAVKESKQAEKWADSFDITLKEHTRRIFKEIQKEHNTQVVRIKGSTILSGVTKSEKLTLLEPKEGN